MSDRVRLTERNYSPKTGAFGKQADPYTMNQERRPDSNPSATKYESGDPDAWAETPISEDRWKAEYAKGRNESGVGNFLDNTWKDRAHPASPGAPKPQYDNKSASETALRQAADERAAALASAKKLAGKALHLAHAVFPKANEKFIFAQARDFMMLPEAALNSTIARILKAGEEMEDEGEEKTSGEVPEAFKKQWDKKDDDKDEKKDEDKKEASTLAADVTRLSTRLANLKKAVRTAGEDTEEEKEEKEASLNLIASLERKLAGLKAKLAGEEKAEKEEEKEDEEKTAARLQAAAARLAGRPVKGGEEKAEKEEEKTAGEEKVEEKVDEDKTAGEEKEDEKEEDKTASEIEIELDAPSMEVASGDDLLDDIFTASNKTASAKPPKKGVAKLGGSTKTASAGMDDLSKLWKSDPDITGDFR